MRTRARRLTPEEQYMIRELYMAGVRMQTIAERFNTTRQTVYNTTQDIGDRGFSVGADQKVHKGKRGRQRVIKFQPSIFDPAP